MRALVLLLPLLAGTPDAGVSDAGVTPGEVAGEWRETSVTTDLLETLRKEGGYGSFLRCIAESDLTATLQEGGPYTLLAPTDEAFARLKKELPRLMADKERLRRTVLFHVMPGRLSLADLRKLRNGDRLPTLLEGKRLKLTVKGALVKVDRAAPVKRELVGSNGIVIPVDAVLLP